MDQDTATRFVSSLVKSIQALCNGYIDFSSSIEVVGHIHLNIDRNVKFDYVLTEEVCKSISEGATVFASHSYHSEPPPSVTANSKTASDALNQNRRKSQVTPNEDPLRLSSLPSEVPKTGKSDNHSRVSSRGDSGDTSHSGSASVSQDSSSFKQENNRKSCQVQESADRRRKSIPSTHRTPSPAAKRSRNYDLNSAAKNTFDVIEIKEEPDDEPTVYFGDNSSHVAAGQDIQTPDFSNVVMESLDRVGQIEGTQLVAGGDGMQQQQSPFPVMLHSTSGMPSSSMPSSSGAVAGPSLDPLATASTSGVEIGVIYSENETISVQLASSEDRAMQDADGSTSRGKMKPGQGYNLKRGKYKCYSETDLIQAVNLVLQGCPYKRATEITGVPCSTITDRMRQLNLSKKKLKKDEKTDYELDKARERLVDDFYVKKVKKDDKKSYDTLDRIRERLGDDLSTNDDKTDHDTPVKAGEQLEDDVLVNYKLI